MAGYIKYGRRTYTVRAYLFERSEPAEQARFQCLEHLAAVRIYTIRMCSMAVYVLYSRTYTIHILNGRM